MSLLHAVLFGGKSNACSITRKEAEKAAKACYAKHNKAGLANVEQLLTDFEGHYDQLYALLEKKYGKGALLEKKNK